MILEVQHETRLSYTDPVTESIAEVHMEPVSDGDQSCRSFHLSVSPLTNINRYIDGFGNRVHHFNVLPPHRELRVLAASVIETHPRPRNLHASSSTYPIDPDKGELELLDYLHLRGPVRESPRLAPLLDQLRPRAGARVGQVVASVSRYINTHFKYTRHVTLASSPIDDVLEQGQGVCQDFTHLMLAILRVLHIPSRYVSGYIHQPQGESQSHAWCEVWLPDLGWVGVDPTNDKIADERFVKVAIGRDFTDVPPNKGLFRGKAEQSIFVRVETRVLDSLPSLSWQEQLPPLQTPLTAIVSPRRTAPMLTEDDIGSEQQQQQQ